MARQQGNRLRTLCRMLASVLILFTIFALTNSQRKTHYSSQLVAVTPGPDNHNTLKNAAKYLYNKFGDGPQSQVAKIVKRKAPLQGHTLKLMKWKEGANTLVSNNADTMIVPERLQIVGHGTKVDNQILMGGLTGEELGSTISRTFGGLNAKIKRVSLVGCSLEELAKEGINFVDYRFSEALLRSASTQVQLDEVSTRNGLVAVSANGRKLYGEITPTGPVWRPKEGAITKSIISLDRFNEVKRDTVSISKASTIGTWYGPVALKLITEDNKFFVEGGVSLEQTEAWTEGQAPGHVNLDSEDLFKVIESATLEHFTDKVEIPKDGSWDNHHVKRQVRMREGDTVSKEINIREFANFQEFETEIKYWGEKGFGYSSGQSTRPTADRSVYYRFGDLVYSMKVQSSLKIRSGPGGADDHMEPFYMEFEGIVEREDVNSATPLKHQNADFRNLNFRKDYAAFQPKTGGDFFSEAKKWMGGARDEMTSGVERVDVANGKAAMAMFVSESIRDWRCHIANRLSIDMNAKMLERESSAASPRVQPFDRVAFFRNHPMARGQTGPLKHSGMRYDFYDPTTGRPENAFKPLNVKKAMAGILQLWVESGYKDTARKLKTRAADSTTQETTSKETKASMVDELKKSVVSLLHPGDNFASHFYQGSELISTDRGPNTYLYNRPYDARPIKEPQTESVDNEAIEYDESEDHSLPLRVSQAMQSDQLYIGKQIGKAIAAKEAVTGNTYDVNEGTVAVEEGKVRFQVYDKANPKTNVEMETEIDESKMTSKTLIEDMHEQATRIQSQGATGVVSKALAIYGAITGIEGTIQAFEKGEIGKGIVTLGQTVHGLGDLSTVNQKVYKLAGKVVGKMARAAIGRASAVVGEVVGENAGKLLAGEGAELLSTVGEIGELCEDIPIVGTAFGMYNIIEDLKKGTPIGYLDAGLDFLITALALLGPEAEPFVIVLTFIRMGIDTFYADLSKELDALPPGANYGQIVVAILKGLGEGLMDFGDLITGGQYSQPLKYVKMEREHRKDEDFLNGLADYHNYYKVTVEDGGAETVNFAGAPDSWNGGEISYRLGESGKTADLYMKSTGTDGVERAHRETLEFDDKVTDVVMGIGEAHTVHMKTEMARQMFLFPYKKEQIITGTDEDVDTLHGEYWGNSDNNTFYAVQEMPDGLTYRLENYAYKLVGMGGDDTFYLGPQYTYVEGDEGADVYFPHDTSCHVWINNYDREKTDDFRVLILPWQRTQLWIWNEGNDCIISAGYWFNITLYNYFHSEEYQHLVLKTSDHMVFRMTMENDNVVFDYYALSAAGNDRGVTLKANAWSLYSTVTEIVGSDYGDTLYGNDQDNLIVGGEGSDYMMGNEGSDTYNIQNTNANDAINNYATDEKIDTVFFPANAEDITTEKNSIHLKVTDGDYNLLFLQYYSGKVYQHVTLYTKDHFYIDLRPNCSSGGTYVAPFMKQLTSSQPNIDLQTSDMLKKIISVVGSRDNNQIYGNDRDNFLSGNGGKDVLAGREGADTYVVKRTPPDRQKRAEAAESFQEQESHTETWGPIPNNGSVILHVFDTQVTIDNFATDEKTDLLLFDENYDDITVQEYGWDLRIRSKSSIQLGVIMKDWFKGDKYQHLLVKSTDGYTFTVPTSPVGSGSSNSDTVHLVQSRSTPNYEPITIHIDDGNVPTLDLVTHPKTAVTIDRTEATQRVDLNLNDGDFSEVTRVIGSLSHYDSLLGNDNDNYFDPRQGGSALQGNGGSDTYVLKPGYGFSFIYNSASDNVADTILFGVKYDQIEVRHDQSHVILTYTNYTHPDQSVSAFLMTYVSSEESRHLTILSSDGITFVIAPEKSFSKVPIMINKASDYETYRQTIQLNTSESWAEVRTVYGASRRLNNITGNDKPNTLVGGSNMDYLEGREGNDVLKGGEGLFNWLYGNEGNDTLVGGSGTDIMIGGPGNDILSPGGGFNIVDGGAGDDTVIYSGDATNETGIYIDLNNGFCYHTADILLDELREIENVYGSPYNDVLIDSTMEDNVLNGREGDDTIIAYDGYDILIGGEGADTYNLETATDTKIIVNKAKDGTMDTILWSYVNKTQMRFQQDGNDLIIRVVSDLFTPLWQNNFPNCISNTPSYVLLYKSSSSYSFCEAFDANQPTLILRDYFTSAEHKHLSIAAGDCTITEDFLNAQPVPVYCFG